MRDGAIVTALHSRPPIGHELAFLWQVTIFHTDWDKALLFSNLNSLSKDYGIFFLIPTVGFHFLMMFYNPILDTGLRGNFKVSPLPDFLIQDQFCPTPFLIPHSGQFYRKRKKCIYMYMCIYIYIHIYIEREREKRENWRWKSPPLVCILHHLCKWFYI